jgi:hypothetical protein
MPPENARSEETEPLLRVRADATLRSSPRSLVFRRGQGTLSVLPSEVSFTPDRWSRKIAGQTDVDHVSHRVVLVHGRFLPPWMRHHLVLVDGRTTASVNLIGKRQQVIEALKQAGFEIEFQESWFAMTRGTLIPEHSTRMSVRGR